MTVHFINVGNDNETFTQDIKVLCYNSLVKAVKPLIKSKIIQFDYKESSNEGIILAGFFRKFVGRFVVCEPVVPAVIRSDN